MSGLIAGAKTIGMYSQQAPSSALPPFAADPDQVLQNILQQLDGLQALVGTKADAGQLKTLIGFSEELVLIQAKEIAVNGAVTFLDLWKDQSGVVTGLVDPSITRIRGGVIQTEQILSGNWGTTTGSLIDLDNGTIKMGGSSAPKFEWNGTDLNIIGNGSFTGTLTAGSIITNSVTIDGVTVGLIASNAEAGYDIQQKLEVSGTTVLRGVIQPDNTGAIAVGSITWNATTGALTGGSGLALTEWGIIGAASGVAKFTIEAATGDANFAGTVTAGAVIAGSVTLSGVSGTPSLSAVAGNALAGFNLQQALEVSGTTVLKGVLVPTDTGALKTGTITWNSTTGALTGGTGVAITEFGIIGAASGSATFTLNASTGAATFAGALSAATGTFAGSLSAATGTFAGSISAATGTFTGTISTSASVLASGGVAGSSGSTAAVVGQSSTQYGVHGYAHTSGTKAGVLGVGANNCHGVLGTVLGGTGYGVYAAEGLGSGGALFADGAADFASTIDVNGMATFNNTVALGTNKFTKTRQNGQLVKIYDTTTHALLNTYEYSFE